MNYAFNGYLGGSGESPYGAHADHKHSVENLDLSTAADVAGLKADLNKLINALKNGGIMTPNQFTLTLSKSLNDTNASHANRQDNTEDISSVEMDGNTIVITLSKPVAELKDFDGLNGWGVHKWLGIGINAGIGTDITKLKYNGSSLTSGDKQEAENQNGLSAGYFVRWVAADLVLAEDNGEKSKNNFTLWADGYEETRYFIKIVEP